MDNFACRYAIIQFRPYTETGEFANIGVVLACPSIGFFDYKILKKKTKRITDFFSPLKREQYIGAAGYFKEALEVTKKSLQGAPKDVMRSQFERLVHPREAIIRFSEPRAILSQDPAIELNRLYDMLVGRDFATKEHVETVMGRSISHRLRDLHLDFPFKQMKVSDDFISVSIPFVQIKDNKFLKGIKPLDLNLQDVNEVFEKGVVWSNKLVRLRSQLPEQIAFVLNPPKGQDDEAIIAIANEATNGLRKAGATVIQIDDLASLDAFAKQ